VSAKTFNRLHLIFIVGALVLGLGVGIGGQLGPLLTAVITAASYLVGVIPTAVVFLRSHWRGRTPGKRL
jgi:hypothetical protein